MKNIIPNFKNLEKILWDFFILINLFALFGGLIYRIYSLNWLGSIIVLILAFISFIILKKLELNNKWNIQPTTNHIQNEANIFFKLIITSYLALTIASFYILFTFQTTDSIVSPWQKVPSIFFLLFFSSTAILFFIYTKHESKIFLVIHSLLALSVAVIVYKIGYGYDPFIHNTTVDLILKNGRVLPKTNYYLGLYGILVILKRFLFIPVYYANLLLIPVFTAIFVPLVLFRSFKKLFENENLAAYSLLTLLILPFSYFIFTTPQNYSYLLLLIVILLSITRKTLYDHIVLLILSLVALITQPIAGIPAFLFVLILLSLKYLKKIYAIITIILLAIINKIALPLSFYFILPQTTQTNEQESEILKTIINKFIGGLYLDKSQGLILNFINFINNYLLIAYLSLSFFGLIIVFRYKKEFKKYIPFFLMYLSITVSALLTSKLNFNFLISYERSNYVLRIFLVSLFFLIPFYIITMHWFFTKLIKKNSFIILSFFIFFSLLITVSLYNSYPRFDNYKNSRGYSTSQFDIEAVDWIEKHSDSNYVVLANQQVSAAALKEFGFSKYYKDDIYFYPVPTSGPLYQIYLDMVYDKPSQDNARKAMDLTGVDDVYFVLNKYWWAFPKIYDEAKLGAKDLKYFGNKDVVVFRYSKE